MEKRLYEKQTGFFVSIPYNVMRDQHPSHEEYHGCSSPHL